MHITVIYAFENFSIFRLCNFVIIAHFDIFVHICVISLENSKIYAEKNICIIIYIIFLRKNLLKNKLYMKESPFLFYIKVIYNKGIAKTCKYFCYIHYESTALMPISIAN